MTGGGSQRTKGGVIVWRTQPLRGQMGGSGDSNAPVGIFPPDSMGAHKMCILVTER